MPESGRTAIFKVQFPSDCTDCTDCAYGRVVALIDDAGNLQLRGPADGDDPGKLNATGIVIANGGPFTLENRYLIDSYSTYQ